MVQQHCYKSFFLYVFVLSICVFLYSCNRVAEDTPANREANALATKADILMHKYPRLKNKPIILINNQAVNNKLLATLQDGTIVVLISGIKVLKIFSQQQFVAYSTKEPNNVFRIESPQRVNGGADIQYTAVIFNKEDLFSYTDFKGRQSTIYSMKDLNLYIEEVNTLIQMAKFQQKYHASYKKYADYY